jgi:pyruvate/2-oxoglutarate dehydrogenase complex dihydrolipoamide acyltransferase (E2) component
LERLPQIELLRIFAGRPAMHGLFEADVTTARRLIRQRAGTGDEVSFTAFLVACLARAMDEHPQIRAFRRGRRRLIVFDDVDVAVLIEFEAGGHRVPLFHVIRDAARHSVAEIHEEITAARSTSDVLDDRRRQIRRARRIPRPVRAAIWRALAASPRAWKRHGGTVVLTSIGMFGNGPGWGLSSPGGYPVGVVVGGIGERPVLANGVLEARELVSLTLSFDHQVIDGAPAARFGARFKELIEEAYGLASGSPTEVLTADG